MDCPVCNKKDIGDNKYKCPQCDTMLAPYNLVKELKAKVKEFDAPGKATKYLIYLFGLLFLVMLLLFLATLFEKERVIMKNKNLVDSIDVLDRNISKIKESTTNAASKNYFKYTVREGDTLWKLSKRFYGTGTLYGQIISDNKLSNNDLKINQELKIYSY